MRYRFLVAGVAALVLLGGCRVHQRRYDLAIRGAHVALEADFPELADERLSKADDLVGKRNIRGACQVHLLRAEARIRTGDLTEAQILAERVANENVAGTRPHAQAQEVLAKVAIRRGHFAAAQAHLVEADRSYQAEGDKQRVSDLMHLVRGLGAFARGDAAAAREHWRSIAEPRLRASAIASVGS